MDMCCCGVVVARVSNLHCLVPGKQAWQRRGKGFHQSLNHPLDSITLVHQSDSMPRCAWRGTATDIKKNGLSAMFAKERKHFCPALLRIPRGTQASPRDRETKRWSAYSGFSQTFPINLPCAHTVTLSHTQLPVRVFRATWFLPSISALRPEDLWKTSPIPLSMRAERCAGI